MQLCGLEQAITDLKFIGVAKHSENGEEFQVYQDSAKTEDIKLGFYRHKKGKFYEVLGTAINPQTKEKLIVYKAMYFDEKRGFESLWLRPINMFLDKDENGTPRFKFIESPSR